MQANIWRRYVSLQQMRKPESKSKQVARYCDIPGRGREVDFKKNLSWELVREPFPMNKTRKPHYTAPLQLQMKY